jgi:integrase
VRKAIGRFEEYTGLKDLATFNKDQAIGFKKHLARTRTARMNEPMALSTMLATTNALKDSLRWISSQPGYKSRIQPTDISYLNLSENDTRAAKQPAPKKFPTVQQIEAVIRAMPAQSEVEQRDRALITLAFLTGARDGALSSLRLKHIDLGRKLVMQDPREVRTKCRKRIDTFLCPMGEEFERIVFDWVRYLREQKRYGNDGPLFPRTRVLPDSDGSFGAAGVEPIAWENTAAVRRIFKAAFARIGLPYFRPHSFRDTLAHFAEQNAPSIEHYKAWSQNIGHDHITTTLTSYGPMSTFRQGELVRSDRWVAQPRGGDEMKRVFDELVRMVRSHEVKSG